MDVLTSGASAELTLFSTVILAVEGLTLWQVPQIFEAEKKSCNSIGMTQPRTADSLKESARQENVHKLLNNSLNPMHAFDT